MSDFHYMISGHPPWPEPPPEREPGWSEVHYDSRKARRARRKAQKRAASRRDGNGDSA